VKLKLVFGYIKIGVWCIAFVLCSLPITIFGQDQAYNPYTGLKEDIYRNPIRAFLNQFSFNFMTGYGRTQYSHDLQGVFFVQDQQRQLILNNAINPIPQEFAGHINWFNEPLLGDSILNRNIFDVPFAPLVDPVNNPLLQGENVLIDTDTTSFGFESSGRSIPVHFSFYYNLMDKFRIGGGLMWERQKFNSFEPTAFSDRVRNFNPGFNKTSYLKYFLLLGYKFYDFWDYSFAVEANIGKAKFGKRFRAIQSGLYTSFNLSIEKNLSEYFRVVMKPTYSLQNFKLNLGDEQATTIDHRNGTFFLQFGISITYPEIPRSPVKSDKVQLKHVIMHPTTGQRMEVRGQPIWKRQNPKVGENHRKLWRYKNGNKKKVNPY
jgi:hypothetical protein